MKNNFFNKSIGNIHSRPSLNSEVKSQILYGEKFRILSQNKNWIKIKTKYDGYTGFIKRYKFLEKFKPTYKIYKLSSRIYKKKVTNLYEQKIFYTLAQEFQLFIKKQIFSNLKKING